MRVVFNTLATMKAKTGVGQYAANLAAHLRSYIDITTFPSFAVDRPAAHIVSNRLALANWLSRSFKKAARTAIGSWFYANYAPGRFDLYHEPNFLPLPSRLPTVITVHDLSVLLHPEWHPADRVRRHEQAFRRAVANAAHIITVSKSVRYELLDTLQVPEYRVSAVPNGVGDEFFSAQRDDVVAERFGLPDNYFLFVGTIEPRKNLLTLLQAWCGLPKTVRSQCPLVLAGSWGWKSADVAEYFNEVAKPKGAIHLGYVGDADRPALYAGARALLFPSHYEGFGLPPLEMLATGGAVIASPTAAHREVLGTCAHFVEAMDIDGWRSALMRAASNDDWLAQIRHGGRERARLFTWDRCAQETAEVYRLVTSVRQAA